MQVRHIASGTLAEVADHVRLPEGWEPVEATTEKAEVEEEKAPSRGKKKTSKN